MAHEEIRVIDDGFVEFMNNEESNRDDDVSQIEPHVKINYDPNENVELNCVWIVNCELQMLLPRKSNGTNSHPNS